MKLKTASQSAFFNLRVLLGVFTVLAGILLALGGLGVFSALAQAQQNHTITANSKDPLVPNGFDCSKIHELGIDRQVNLRAGAIMIACGEARGGSGSHSGIVSQFIQKLPLISAIKKLLLPLAYGAADVDLITGTETFPHVTQSTTFTAANPDNPNQIVVAYNDSRGFDANPPNGAGASVSTDGGTTFTRLTKANGQSPFDNSGSPVALYSRHSSTWYTVWLDGVCGGIGGYKSTTAWDPNSWTHFCIHNGQDDRQSGWVDNNPSSPHYGNIYVSWNDFNSSCGGGGCLFVTVSTDDGATWTPHQVTSGSPFIRDVQITGDLVTGDVYIAGMDEGGGGFPHNDTNHIFRSTDGGNTWTNTYTGTSFPGPGVGSVGYFALMFPDGGGYWRYEGWGEPAALNGIVHLVYAQHGTGSDPGDVYYIRSTDGGVTFGTPFKLNTDATARAQWEPSLSVGTDGSLFATWYDQRETDSCTEGNPSVPCYRMWGRKSTDNGLTWAADMAFSDVVSPLPDQADPGIVTTYASDYDYGSSVLNQHLRAWVDGRVTINGISQQDAFFDREPSTASTPSPTPAASATPSLTPTATPTTTPIPRITPTPRSRPTPAPRPSP